MDQIEIIQQIEHFYNSAWNKLIITGSIIFGVFGIIVPIVFQFFQRKTLKLQEREIKIDIEKQLDNQKKILQEEIKGEYKKEIKKLEKELEKRSSGLKAMTMQLQANSHLSNKNFVAATHDYLRAIQYYLFSKDYGNMRTLSDFVINSCLNKINKEEIEDIFQQLDCSNDAYFEELERLDNENNVLSDIKDLKYHINRSIKNNKTVANSG